VANLQKYNKAFMDTFQIGEDKLKSLKYNEIETWDSVGHMTLIAAVDEQFNITLSTDDIIDLSSYQKGKDILRKYNIEF